nr:type II toxin-antitoxin system VapC family toxin [Nakamurella aerolata]
MVLDSEAMSVLARARGGRNPGAVLAALRAAVESDRPVVVPAAVLAELYRGGSHDQSVDSCLGAYTGIAVADTDRSLARRIGHLLAKAGRGSRDHVDATVVAVALRSSSAVIATADPDDLRDLADGLPSIKIEPV